MLSKDDNKRRGYTAVNMKYLKAAENIGLNRKGVKQL
jgi:hypothetical protein